MKYPHITDLHLNEAHDDYVEQFQHVGVSPPGDDLISSRICGISRERCGVSFGRCPVISKFRDM
jgi:hypothetical protein